MTELKLLDEVATVTTKDQMLKAIQDLPADATIVDAVERLYLLQKIERGLPEADSGQTVSQAEARQRIMARRPFVDYQIARPI